MDFSSYYGVFVALALAVVVSFIGWKYSGEPFSETKFFRTVLLAVLSALGLSVLSLVGVGDIYSTSSLSPLLGLLGSKGLNYLNEVPTNIKQDISAIVQQVLVELNKKQTITSTSAPVVSTTITPTAQAP
jgi:hypothetical protein